MKLQRGVVISARAAQNLEAIVSKVREVDQLVADIATACAEHSQGIEQINTAVAQMDKVTQSTAGMAEQTAIASEELTGQAKSLKYAVKILIEMIEEVRNNPEGESDPARFSAAAQDEPKVASRNGPSGLVTKTLSRKASVEIDIDGPASAGR